VTIRRGGKREQQTVLVKNIILDSIRREIEQAQKAPPPKP
jgi:hypothetical protein